MKAKIHQAAAFAVTSIGELVEFRDSIRFEIDATMLLSVAAEPVLVIFGDGRWKVMSYGESDELVEDGHDIHQIVPIKCVLEEFIAFETAIPVTELCPSPTT